MKTLGFLVAFFVATCVIAEDKCPISGQPAKEQHSLEVNGKKVSFCCDKCPEVYKKKINLVDEGPKTCPVSGKPAAKEHSLIEKRAEAVYFCCNNCPKEFAKKNKIEFKDEGPKKCPISGAPAKDGEGTSLVVNGEKVYFCCEKCPKAFKKNLGLDKAEVTKCPISGKEGKAETEQILIRSKTVYFCCGNCPKEYAKKNFKDGIVIASEEKKKAEPEKSKP